VCDILVEREEIRKNVTERETVSDIDEKEPHQHLKRRYSKGSKLTKKKGDRAKKKLCKPEEVELFQFLLLFLLFKKKNRLICCFLFIGISCRYTGHKCPNDK